MVKSGSDRSDKYSAKFDAEVIRTRYTATATMAKARQVAMQSALADLASFVRGALNTAGILPILTILYLSFANKLFGICTKFAGFPDNKAYSLTARNTALFEIAKWKDMAGTDALLTDIWNYFTVCLGAAPSPIP